jgi:hypothetical protein
MGEHECRGRAFAVTRIALAARARASVSAWYKAHAMRLSLLALVLISCASERVDAPPPVPADWRSINAPPAVVVKGPTAKERAIAEAYVTALGSPAFDKIGAMFDEMGHVGFGRHEARGRDKIIEVHKALFGAFDDRKCALGRIWRTDDVQIVEWVMTGVQAREWFGVAQTQRPVVIRGTAVLWTQDEGTLTDAHLYFSIPVVKAQLGVGPKELQDFVATSPPAPLTGAFDKEDSPREKLNEAVVRTMLDDFENGKENDFLAAFTDNVEIESVSRPKTQKKEDVRSYYRSMRRLIGALDTQVVSLRAVTKYVLLENLISGEQYAAVGYTPAPPDHAASIEMADVIELTDDNKIAHIWRYENPDWP